MKIQFEEEIKGGAKVFRGTFTIEAKCSIALEDSEREDVVETIKSEIIHALEQGLENQFYAYAREKIKERNNPTVAGLTIYKLFSSPQITEGHPILLLHPIDELKYIKNGVVSFK